MSGASATENKSVGILLHHFPILAPELQDYIIKDKAFVAL